MDDPSIFPRSVGEELFLVHLRREAESEGHGEGTTSRTAVAAGHGQGILKNPIAISAQRKREHTAGEELWLVHCKRSRGMTFDSDEDHHHHHEEGSDHEKDGTHRPKSPTAVASSSKKRSKSRGLMSPPQTRHCPYNLRSKDVTCKKWELSCEMRQTWLLLLLLFCIGSIIKKRTDQPILLNKHSIRKTRKRRTNQDHTRIKLKKERKKNETKNANTLNHQRHQEMKWNSKTNHFFPRMIRSVTKQTNKIPKKKKKRKEKKKHQQGKLYTIWTVWVSFFYPILNLKKKEDAQIKPYLSYFCYSFLLLFYQYVAFLHSFIHLAWPVYCRSRWLINHWGTVPDE